MEKKLYLKAPHCARCGSLDVTSDAVARWSPELQKWIMSDVHDGNLSCGVCEGDCEADWRETPIDVHFSETEIPVTLPGKCWFVLFAAITGKLDGLTDDGLAILKSMAVDFTKQVLTVSARLADQNRRASQ